MYADYQWASIGKWMNRGFAIINGACAGLNVAFWLRTGKWYSIAAATFSFFVMWLCMAMASRCASRERTLRAAMAGGSDG